jgi:hypothetical protein
MCRQLSDRVEVSTASSEDSSRTPDRRGINAPGLKYIAGCSFAAVLALQMPLNALVEPSGVILRTIRRQWQLSLREVEERSIRFSQEWGKRAYRISAGWLQRLECGKHELNVNKPIVLAAIYNISPEQLLRSIYPGDPQPVLLRKLFSPNATLGPDQPPDETRLLSRENGLLPAPYRRGIIGKRDRTLAPMIPAGSIVQIDTQKRAISSRKDWTHEFQRPIYFLMTREGYVCGWCELDRASDWLTLIPHPLSSVSSRRWKYRTEIENLGRVVAVAIRLGE